MTIFMQLFILGLSITANAFLGFLVLLKNVYSPLHRRFAILTGAIVFWTLIEFLYYVVPTQSFLLLIGRLSLASMILIPLAAFYFISLFPTRRIKIQKLFSWLVYIFSALLFSLCLTPLVDMSESATGTNRLMMFGPLYGIFITGITLLCLLTLSIAIQKWRIATGVIKIQLFYFSLGFVSLFLAIVLFNGIIPFFFQDSELKAFGSLASVGFIGFMTYAMIKHQFMDINRLVSSFLIQASSFTFLGFLYSIGAYVVGYFFFPKFLDISYIIAAVFAALCIKFALRPFHRYFLLLAEFFFMRGVYNRQKILSEFQKIVASTMDLRYLVEHVLFLLAKEMEVTRITYISLAEDRPMVVASTNPSTKRILKEEDMAVVGQVIRPTFRDVVLDKKLHTVLAKYRIELIFPLPKTKTHRRFLLFNNKKSGAPYYDYDVKTIALLAQPFLIAIQNARHLYDIKQFNKRLSREVTKATREIRRVNTQLRQADKLKDEFISIASHELKTPTTAIQGFLWLVLQKDKTLSSYSKEKLEKVAKLTEHMTMLVNDMLDVSKIESNRINLHPEAFDIHTLAQEVKGELDLIAVQKSLQIHVGKGEKYMVWADRQRMHQVMSNLLSNAVKYTKVGGKIKVFFDRNDTMTKIMVKDTGIGIREEDMPRLFTKFGKIDDDLSLNAHLPGSGLGLYITKNLIELSGGTIWAESKFGKGSTFIFTLPKGS